MSKFWSSMLVLVVATLFAVGSVSAQEGKKKGGKKGERKRPSAEQIFKKLDADGDGFITVAEMLKSPRIKDKAAAEKRIERMDTDKDDTVSLEEFEAAMKKWREARKKGGHKRGDHKKGGHKKGDHKKKPADKK